MAGRIPDRFIDELMNRVDIVDVIGGRLELKRAGQNLQALCPFHGEKTPSFTVSPSKQFYHCFGCGAHGTAIRFLMEYDRLEFRDAVEQLARHVGLELPEEARDQPGEDLAPLYQALTRAAKQYQQWLRRHPARQPAVDYLMKRGLTGQIALDYGLGFAPEGWDNLISALGQPDVLLKAGLATHREDSRHPYDRFRGRIMFPIRDRRGRIIGFGGRVLGSGEPKYLNSPETPVFHKGKELYGLYECLQTDHHPRELIVVEGYMDVVALAQYGLRQAVATLGTATSTTQVERLFQATGTVIFCFDGDKAGRAAATRALESALPVMRDGRQARFLFLPEGEDPDSLVRKEGVDAFRARLKEARALSDFFFEQAMDGADMSSMDGRAKMAERARPGLVRLPPGIFRDMMVERLAELARVDARRMEQSVARDQPAPAQPKANAVGAPRVSRTIRVAIALLLQRPELGALATQPERYHGHDDIPGLDLLARLLDAVRAEPQLSSAAILERFRDSPDEATLWKLATWDHLVPESGFEMEFRGALEGLERLLGEKRLQYLNERLLQGVLTSEELREWQDLKSGRRAPNKS